MALSVNPVITTGGAPGVDGSRFSQSWGVLHSDRLMHPVDVAEWPVRIDTSRQLFVDDYLIAESEGLHRRQHQPRKHPANPVMVGERPWEGFGPVLAHCLRDETSGRFRLWYRSRLDYQEGGRSYSFPNMYAESGDGLHWERPSLGLWPWKGSKDNNIILPCGDLRGLIHEPDDAEAPWKAVWEHASPARCPDGVEQEGCHLYTSRDGVRWSRAALVVPYGPRMKGNRAQALPLTRLGDTGHYRRDRRLGRYICDAKGTVPSTPGSRPPALAAPAWVGGTGSAPPGPVPGIHHRFRLQMESDDLVHWTRPRVVAFPDEADLQRGVIGFYGLLGTTYESQWIGYLRVHRMAPWKRVDVQLVTSRDGRTWSRACDRGTFLPLGPEGSWEPDYSEINHAGPLLVDDELWFFYRGSVLERERGTGPDIAKGMGLATLRRDGFASLTPDGRGGSVTTRPLTIGGNRLYVNADVRAGGSVRVAALDRDGRPLEALGAADCRPAVGTGTAQPVTWATGELGATEQCVRLRFHVENADLYAFWIA